MKVTVEKIGPDEAAALLTTNTGNRKLRKDRVENYASAMEAGRWMLTGEAIKVDTTGRLLDGQHRLAAVIKSGATIEAVVCRGLGEETFKVLDSGMARTVGDAFGTMGKVNGNVIAATVNLVLAYEQGNVTSSRRRHAVNRAVTIDRYMLDPEGFDHVALRSEHHWRRKFPQIISSVAAALCFIQPEAEEFVERVVVGNNLDVGDPRLALRNYLINSAVLGRRSQASMFSAHIYSWNAYAEGREQRLVRATTTPFPVIQMKVKRKVPDGQEESAGTATG